MSEHLSARLEGGDRDMETLGATATSLQEVARHYAAGGTVEQTIRSSREELAVCGQYMTELYARREAGDARIASLQQQLDDSSEVDFGEAAGRELTQRHKDTIYQLVTDLRDARRQRRQFLALIEQADAYAAQLRTTIDVCETMQLQLPEVTALAQQLRVMLEAVAEVPSMPERDFVPAIEALPERPIVPAPHDTTFIRIADQAMRTIEPGAKIFGEPRIVDMPPANEDEAPTQVFAVCRAPELRQTTREQLT